jgi:hypothetical protein
LQPVTSAAKLVVEIARYGADHRDSERDRRHSSN